MTTTCGCQMQLWGVPRSAVIFYACAAAGGRSVRRMLQLQAFCFCPTMAYECITSAHTAPSRPHRQHFHFTWSQMSSPSSSLPFPWPWRLLLLLIWQSWRLWHSLPATRRIHNFHINLIFQLCMSAKKLSPAREGFYDLPLMDFKWTLTHAMCPVTRLRPTCPKMGVG